MQRGTDRGRGRGGPERGRPFRGPGPGSRGVLRGPTPGGRGRGFLPREQGGYVSHLALRSSPVIFVPHHTHVMLVSLQRANPLPSMRASLTPPRTG